MKLCGWFERVQEGHHDGLGNLGEHGLVWAGLEERDEERCGIMLGGLHTSESVCLHDGASTYLCV